MKSIGAAWTRCRTTLLCRISRKRPFRKYRSRSSSVCRTLRNVSSSKRQSRRRNKPCNIERQGRSFDETPALCAFQDRSRAAARRGGAICENQQDRWHGGSTSGSQCPISRGHRSRCFAPRTKDAVDARIPPTASSVGTGVEAVCAQIWKK